MPSVLLSRSVADCGKKLTTKNIPCNQAWGMDNVSTPVVAKKILKNEKIVFDWDVEHRRLAFI
jgi:hypothetical protein